MNILFKEIDIIYFSSLLISELSFIIKLTNLIIELKKKKIYTIKLFYTYFIKFTFKNH